MAKTPPKDDTALCVLHESDRLKANLFKDGEGFRIRFDGTGRKDREFDSLPTLLAGLHGIFIEIRMGAQGIRGFDALARVSDDARQDVLAASRKIHQALGTV